MLMSNIIEHHARYRRSHPALIMPDGSWTYGELGEKVARCAHLLTEYGVKRGDRVAVLTENSPWFLVIFYATASIGGILVKLNYRLSGAELIDNIHDASVSALFIQSSYLPHVLEASDGPLPCKLVSLQRSDIAPDLPTLLEGQPTDPVEAEVSPDDPVLMQFTSGTTGKPKGVLSKQSAWVQSCMIQAPLKMMNADSVFIGVQPMCYTGGFKASMEILFGGGTLVICSRFDAEDVLDKIERYGATNMYLVPTMLFALLDAQATKPRNVSTLRAVNCGGSPLNPDQLRQAYELFDCFLTQGYGMTELAGGSISFAGPRDSIFEGKISPKLASVGQPLIDCKVKLVDDDGNEVPTGTPGEVLVKTDRALIGYWGKSASETPIDEDGYYHTGDVAQFDEDGYLYLVDRKKDMIISGGLNIYPKEVEQVLNNHDDVAEAYVVGLPDDKWGERVHAFVVLSQGAEEDAGGLEQWCRQHLGSYKVPKSFAFVTRDSLPVNWGNKVMKRVLRDDYLKEAKEGVSN